MTRKEDAGGVSENVKVVVRCRPLNSEEVQDGRKRIVSMDTKAGQIFIKNPKAPEEPPKTFSFDLVYDENVRQIDLYNEVARPVVESVIEGFNGTIFAYGQTGTGKTHTMDGGSTAESQGIIPNSFDQVFNFIAATDHREFLVRGSFLEIYNEEIRDLLSRNPKNKLELKEDQDGGVFVKDLSNYVVKSVSDIKQVLEVGKRNRSVGATKMNLGSSRSHSVFTITIESTMRDERGDEHVRVGKLNLVDLAGSERATKTGATGDRFKEGVKINLSLAALGNVINALVEGKSGHIPYRDSKLTRLLQDSLGGNTKTCMVANISPADYNYDETISTLRYANRAKNIQNKPKINEDPKDAMIREMQEKVARLKAELAAKAGGAPPPPQVVKKVVEEGPGEDQLLEIRENMMRELKEKMEAAANEKARAKAKEDAESMARKALEALLQEQNKTDEQRKAIQAALAKQHAEMEAYASQIEEEQQEKERLEAQLREIESKVLEGGVNLIEQVEKLEREGEDMERNMMIQRRQEEELARRLRELKEEEMLEQKKFKDVKEEVAAINKRITEVQQQYDQRMSEVNEVQKIHQLEREDLLGQIRELEQIIKLRDLVISWFIPPEFLAVIKDHCYQDPTTEDWVVNNAHFAGNAAREQAEAAEANRVRAMDASSDAADTASVYYSYKQLKGEDSGQGRSGSAGSGTGRASGMGKKRPQSRIGSIMARPSSTREMKVPTDAHQGKAGGRPPPASAGEAIPWARGLVKR